MKSDFSSVKRILVLRYRSIGDILLANPALKALRARFPDAYIDLVVDDLFADLLDGNPNVDNVTPHPRNRKGSKLLTDIGMIRKFRSGNYDLVVDLQGGPRGAWTSFFSGAKIRVGHYFKLRNSLLYNLRAETPSPVDHTWRVQFMIVRPLGIKWPDTPRFYLSVSRASADSMRRQLESAGLMFDRPLVLLHPGARVQVKRWSSARMGALARWLVDEKQCAVVLAGSQNDLDEIKLIRRTAKYALPSFTDLDLGQLSALIKSCAMVICNDSGPMHMAGVLNIPTISLFGPSDPIIWGPVGERNISLTCSPPMECMPCDQRSCPHSGHHCMTKIELDDVKRAVIKLDAL